MIHHVHFPPKFHHNIRNYLTEWFDHDILVVTDVDLCVETDLQVMVEQHACKNIVVDLSLNFTDENTLPEFLKGNTVLSTVFTNWYNHSPDTKIHYFPIWFWCFNQRHCSWFPVTRWDASDKKTLPMMCFNRNLPNHRIMLRHLLDPVADQIQYTMGKGMAGDTYDLDGAVDIDIGITHPMYDHCAVNLVTESAVEYPSLSEKCCKPFAAQQIPVILGCQHINQFLSDLGLDMFSDLVPWQSWDHNPDTVARTEQVASFVKSWINSGTILQDYESVRHRVQANKQYLHSEQFKQQLLKCMPNKKL